MTTDNTARPAPTPAPVAVPEGVVRALRTEDERLTRIIESGGPFSDQWHVQRIQYAEHDRKAIREHLASLDAPRPEPVVAPDGCAEDCEQHASCRASATPQRFNEPVVAPLPSEAVRETLVRDVLKALRTAWQDDYSTRTVAEGVADAVLAAGYRLVPEDDEDTVRVPRSISDSWAMDLWWKVTGDNWPVPEHMPGKFLRHFLHILENGGTR